MSAEVHGGYEVTCSIMLLEIQTRACIGVAKALTSEDNTITNVVYSVLEVKLRQAYGRYS